MASITTLFLDYGFNLKGLVLTSKKKEEINEELFIITDKLEYINL